MQTLQGTFLIYIHVHKYTYTSTQIPVYNLKKIIQKRYTTKKLKIKIHLLLLRFPPAEKMKEKLRNIGIDI